MKEIWVLAEHRRGQIRDISFEMLTKARELAEEIKTEVAVVLLGETVGNHAKALAEQADKVLLIEDPELKNFHSETYQSVLLNLMKKHEPLLLIMGHTSFGVELAPSLAVASNTPLATDCIDLKFEDERLSVTRQMYGGKVNVKAYMRQAGSYIVTVRQATFQPAAVKLKGEIITTPPSRTTRRKSFIEYVLPPPGGVDITAADSLIGVGRGIKDESAIPQVEELAKVLGGTLACSRPIVDKGWLPDDRQVGSSGKTVKPKLYLALGISGAFQHVLGMKKSELIIAVNKDPNAPIFSVADYGIVEDLFKIVPSLKTKISELKG